MVASLLLLASSSLVSRTTHLPVTHAYPTPLGYRSYAKSKGNQSSSAHPTVTNLGEFSQYVVVPTLNADSLTQVATANAIQCFYTLPGKIISQGKNTTPTAAGLLTYRVEEVVLAAPVTLDSSLLGKSAHGKKSRTVDRVWRLTITAQHFGRYIGSGYYSAWLDDTFLGFSTVGEDATTLTTLVLDYEDFHNGATIYISTSEGNDRLMALPEKLYVPTIP